MAHHVFDITVHSIRVSTAGWWSFEYAMAIIVKGDDGVARKKTHRGKLDGSFSSQTAEAFRKVLKRGYAVTLVVQHHYA